MPLTRTECRCLFENPEALPSVLAVAPPKGVDSSILWVFPGENPNVAGPPGGTGMPGAAAGGPGGPNPALGDGVSAIHTRQEGGEGLSHPSPGENTGAGGALPVPYPLPTSLPALMPGIIPHALYTPYFLRRIFLDPAFSGLALDSLNVQVFFCPKDEIFLFSDGKILIGETVDFDRIYGVRGSSSTLLILFSQRWVLYQLVPTAAPLTHPYPGTI